GRLGAVAAADLDGGTVDGGGLRGRRRRGFRHRIRGLGGLGTGSGLAYDRRIHNRTSLSPAPMSDNPQAAAPAFRLPHDVLAITGRDAAAFAQAQFMNDVAVLADGHWQWSGW